MNRGSVRPRGNSEPRRAPFNEAPIHESGKYGSCTRIGRAGGSFNEAPIHESGKSAIALFRLRNWLALQ